MATAIIGLGNIGSKLATNLVNGGEQIFIADNTLEKAQKLATTLGDQAHAVEIADAVHQADVIILAIWFDAIKGFFKQYEKELAGKIIVDPSNPIAPDDKGGFVKTIPEDQSSGQLLAAILPTGVTLVKAFGTVAADSLNTGANRKPERAVEFYAADDQEAGKVVAKLISANGFDPLYIGGIDQSIRIEVFGDLHEYGKLGKLVSLDEAKAAI